MLMGVSAPIKYALVLFIYIFEGFVKFTLDFVRNDIHFACLGVGKIHAFLQPCIGMLLHL